MLGQPGLALRVIRHGALHAQPERWRVVRLVQVGHLVQMAVSLPNGDQIGIEGHADKYGGRFAAGDKAQIAWKPSGATVIIH